jgi:hypothetical protein
MSLTILIHEKLPVVIVRWFLDLKGNVIFATGPVVQMPLNEFRASGYDWVRRHFEEYLRIRLPEQEVVPVFESGEAKKLMKGRRALEIGRYPDGTLLFLPKEISKYALADLKGVGKEARRTIPENSPPEVFWTAFDEALAAAPPDE